MPFIFELAIILFAGKIAGELSARLGQPSVLGKLLVGLLIGPAVLGLVSGSASLEVLSQIGVIMLMFIAGLETDLEELKHSGKAASFIGLSGVIFPLLTGFFAGLLMNLNIIGALFLGLLLSATSVSISVQTLKELRILRSRVGSAILGAAVIDDLVVIMALAFLMSMTGREVNLTIELLKKIVYFSGAILLAWKVVPWILSRATSFKVTEPLISAALTICFLYAFSAELAGVASIIGAYIAGAATGLSKYKAEIIKKVETIGYSVFIPVFFTTIGMKVSLTGISQNIGLIIGLSILAILTKLIGAAIGAKLAKFPSWSSLGIGAAMVSRGEVALIVAEIGNQSRIISKNFFAAIVIVVLITTVVTPPLMKYFFHHRTNLTLSKQQVKK